MPALTLRHARRAVPTTFSRKVIASQATTAAPASLPTLRPILTPAPRARRTVMPALMHRRARRAVPTTFSRTATVSLAATAAPASLPTLRPILTPAPRARRTVMPALTLRRARRAVPTTFSRKVIASRAVTAAPASLPTLRPILTPAPRARQTVIPARTIRRARRAVPTTFSRTAVALQATTAAPDSSLALRLIRVSVKRAQVSLTAAEPPVARLEQLSAARVIIATLDFG